MWGWLLLALIIAIVVVRGYIIASMAALIICLFPGWVWLLLIMSEALEHRLDLVEKRYGTIDRKLDQLTTDVADIHGHIKHLPTAADITRLSNEVAELRGQIRYLPTAWQLTITMLARQFTLAGPLFGAFRLGHRPSLPLVRAPFQSIVGWADESAISAEGISLSATSILPPASMLTGRAFAT